MLKPLRYLFGLATLCGIVFAQAGWSQSEGISDKEQARFQEVQSQLRAGGYKDARVSLLRMNKEKLSSDVARTEQQLLLGQAELGLQNFDGAIAALTNVIQFPLVDPTTALINRCFAYLQLGLFLDAELDCSEARRGLDNAVLTGGNEPLEVFLREYRFVSLAQVEAELYNQAGQTVLAKDILQNAVNILAKSAKDETRPKEFRLEPKQYWGIELTLARTYVALGQWDAASRSLDDVFNIIPDAEKHRAIAVRASVFRGQGQAREAAKAWTEAHRSVVLANEDDLPGIELRNQYLYFACATLIQQKDYAAALPICESLARADKSNGVYAEAHAYAAMQALGVLQSFEVVRRASDLQRDAFILDVARRKLFEDSVDAIRSGLDARTGTRVLRAWDSDTDEQTE